MKLYGFFTYGTWKYKNSVDRMSFNISARDAIKCAHINQDNTDSIIFYNTPTPPWELIKNFHKGNRFSFREMPFFTASIEYDGEPKYVSYCNDEGVLISYAQRLELSKIKTIEIKMDMKWHPRAQGRPESVRVGLMLEAPGKNLGSFGAWFDQKISDKTLKFTREMILNSKSATVGLLANLSLYISHFLAKWKTPQVNNNYDEEEAKFLLIKNIKLYAKEDVELKEKMHQLIDRAPETSSDLSSETKLSVLTYLNELLLPLAHAPFESEPAIKKDILKKLREKLGESIPAEEQAVQALIEPVASYHPALESQKAVDAVNTKEVSSSSRPTALPAPRAN